MTTATTTTFRGYRGITARWLLAILVLTLGLTSGCKCKSSGPASREAGLKDSSLPPLVPSDLTGVVVDRRGVPLPDVLVIAWPKGKRGDAVAQARTGDDGHFLLPGLRPDRWMLLVETGGLGTLETERQVPDDGPARLMLEGESRSLSGIVVDGLGRPVRDAEVTLGGPGLRWTRAATSDANGIFVLGGLGNGRFTLRAIRGQHASAAAVVVFEVGMRAPVHVRLALQPGAKVEGRVVDDTGRPLAGAAVDVMVMPFDDLPISGQSGRDGRFELGPVAPGRYQVLARFDDFVLIDAPEAHIGGRARESFNLRMARPARVSGRVRDEAGRSVVGVQASVISLVGGRDDLVVIPGALPLAAEAAELPVGRLLRPGGVRSCPTDKDGGFTITGLAPGRARLEILHPDKLPLRREPLLLVPGGTHDVGDLTLVAGAILACRVVDGEGRGIEGARVEARPAAQSVRASLKTTTDDNGEFLFRLPLGSYTLTAQTQSLALPSAKAINIRSDIAADDCVMQLLPKAGNTPRR